MDYAGRNLLVTGGAGFIGSHLVDRLVDASPASVHVVDNLFLGREENLADARKRHPDVRFHRMDATDGAALRGLIRAARVDVVFNLATKALGYSFDDPADAYLVNVQIAAHLLEALRAREYAWLVHCSSSEADGTAVQVPMGESHPLLPHTPYAAGKAGADLMVRAYHETFALPVVSVRPFNNYGPRQNEGLYAGIIPITMTRIARGQAPVIQGDGAQTRDFLFVRDTARLIATLGRREDLAGHVLNLGSGVEVSVADLVRRICAVSGFTGAVERAPARPADVRRHRADVAALHAALGDPGLTPLDEGLAETWRWYRARVLGSAGPMERIP